MKAIRKILSLALAALLLGSCLAHAAIAQSVDTPWIPVPDENEGIFVSPFYYTFSGTSATVVGYGGWSIDVSIPETVEYDGVTYTVTAIGEDAFAADNTISSVTLSVEIKTVAQNAFYGCTKLADVWYEGTESHRASITFGTNNEALTGATWHYEACIHNPAKTKEHAFDNACDAACNYCDFTRTVPDHDYDDDKDVTCNECGFMRLKAGDLDENNSVDMDDAIYLLFHYFFPEYYPINQYQAPDYDKDGDVDMDDAFYLLYHTYFPERFPIQLNLPQ